MIRSKPRLPDAAVEFKLNGRDAPAQDEGLPDIEITYPQANTTSILAIDTGYNRI